jgi:hypothetical protein
MSPPLRYLKAVAIRYNSFYSPAISKQRSFATANSRKLSKTCEEQNDGGSAVAMAQILTRPILTI